jgi:hypothetical protein
MREGQVGPGDRSTAPRSGVLGPFYAGERLSWALVGLFVAVNAVVALNAALHDPRVGYDVERHLDYVGVLGGGQMPRDPEFFDPPLSYVLPALVYAGTHRLLIAAKVAQALNLLFSVGVTYGLLRLAALARPADLVFRGLTLGGLGLLPVYYKSFALVRPEPLLALLTMAATYLAARIVLGRTADRRRLLWLGVLAGLLVLTRQQGLFVAAATAGCVGIARWRRSGARAAAGALALVAVPGLTVGGWFYVHLAQIHGTPAAFNRQLSTRELEAKPASFYLGLGLPEVFRDPVRPAFERQVLPTLYSEVWGDYYQRFLIYRGFRRPDGRLVQDTNRPEMGRYLGRVNAVSLLPTLVLLGGLVVGAGHLRRLVRAGALDQPAAVTGAVAGAVVALSLAAYAVFLGTVPEHDGDTIKATYLVHVAPLAAFLGADALGRLRDRSPRWFAVLAIGLLLVAVHNYGTYVTRYTPLPD